MSSDSAENENSSKHSTPNSTSTWQYAGSSYEHEPYETFQSKVLKLARTLCDAAEVEIQQKRGGSYNRVVVVRLTLASEHLTGIFRIPRDKQVPEDDEQSRLAVHGSIHDQVAVIQLLESRRVPAPALIAFDATANNAINSPYVLLELATGASLYDVYDDMSLEEKFQLADSLVEFLTRMEEVQFSQCGTVIAEPTECLQASRLSAPLDRVATTIRGLDTAGMFGYGRTRDDTRYASTSTQELIRDLLQAHLKLQESRGDEGEFDLNLWKQVSSIFEDMCDLNLFLDLDERSHKGSILYHWDLEPRNILVRQIPAKDSSSSTGQQNHHLNEDSSTRWAIDKVIDWDKVQAIPPVLARKPPVWLWDPSHEEFCSKPNNYEEFTYDGDVDLLPASRYGENQSTFSPDDRALRTYFEECFVRAMQRIYPGYILEAYKDEAYGRGRWIRRIARFALNGFGSSEDIKRLERLKENWAEGRLHFAIKKLSLHMQ